MKERKTPIKWSANSTAFPNIEKVRAWEEERNIEREWEREEKVSQIIENAVGIFNFIVSMKWQGKVILS